MKLSPLRAAKTLYSLAALVRDPNRLGKVFEMADALATPELLGPMVALLGKEPEGARAFAEKPRLKVDLVELRTLPPCTFGRSFADDMDRQGLDPSALPNLPTPDDHAYLRAHLYETHDVWHIVTGFGTDWKGEIGLQAFYLSQIPGPLSAALLAVGCLRLAAYEMESRDALMGEIIRGWEMGKRARPLFGVRWNDLWTLSLGEVRARLGVSVARSSSERATALAA